MKSILVLSFFPAFVPPSNGGESRLVNFYRAMSHHCKVVLLSSTGPGMAADEVWHTDTFVEKRVPRDQAFLEAWQQLVLLGSGGDLSAPALLRSCGNWTRLHDAFLEHYPHTDVVVHESPFTLGADVFLGCDTKPRIYCAYNCEAALYKTLHPAEKSSPFVQEIERAEKDLLHSADALFYCADNDVEQMRAFADLSALQLLYTPHGVASAMLSSVKPNAMVLPGQASEVYFVGSAHPPNVRSAQFIAGELAPAMPQVTFHLIGGCGDSIKPLKNLRVHGFVSKEKMQSIIDRCVLAINPMGSGGGASLKILDFIAAGKPVLSTKYGMRGYGFLPGFHYLESDLARFQQTLGDALAQPATALLKLAENALDHVRSSLTWESIAERVAAKITSLIEYTRTKEKYALVLNDYNSFDSVGGGATRTRGLCEALARRGPVVFVTYSDRARLRNYRIGGVRVLEVPRPKSLEQEIDQSRGESHISVADILTSMHLPRDDRMQAIYLILRKHASVVAVEHCYMASLPLQAGDRFVYSSQNNEIDLKRGLLAGHAKRDALLAHVENLELRCISASSLTVAVSDEDAAAFTASHFCTAPVVVVPNGVVPDKKLSHDLPLDTKLLTAFQHPVNVVFLGSAHMPNVLAALFLVKEVVRRCHNLHFHFVGSVCTSIVNQPANLTLWGMVSGELKDQILGYSQIALNPVLEGSGSNMKFADYLANGLPTLSTEFGLRGYPGRARAEARVAEQDRFSQMLQTMAAEPDLWSEEARKNRIQIFHELLDFRPISDRFAQLVYKLNNKRKHVLFVTYRYTDPARGGAEVYARHLIEALDRSGNYNIDVLTTDVCTVIDIARFTSDYKRQSSSTFNGLPNTRVVRFPVKPATNAELLQNVRPVWLAQIGFEKALWLQLRRVKALDNTRTTLLWGWAHAEGNAGHTVRWAFRNAGLSVAKAGKVELKGQTNQSTLVRISVYDGAMLFEKKLDGAFSITLSVEYPCVLEIDSTCPVLIDDARPLALLVKSIEVAGDALELTLERPIDMPSLKRQFSDLELIDMLAQASDMSRARVSTSLTAVRGPHSPLLEDYLTEQVEKYDLVVTHNVVFKTAQVAISAAKQHGVPSILVPHVHLDDDYYHFPDLLQTAQQSALVLASPMDAVRYYAQRQCNVEYLPAGIDEEEFSQPVNHDLFDGLYRSKLPFVLVLGRKSGAKNYEATIRAVERINEKGARLNVVMIGPDDDQKAINSPYLFYLGAQPRGVVLSALHNCFLLCNMSQSESFGIVLLEAWMAGKPVLANSQCGAFVELVNHGENGFLVTEATLTNGLVELLENPGLAQSMGAAGKVTALAFTWNSMQQKFLQFAEQILEN